jgi:hypothetical protein
MENPNGWLKTQISSLNQFKQRIGLINAKERWKIKVSQSRNPDLEVFIKSKKREEIFFPNPDIETKPILAEITEKFDQLDFQATEYNKLVEAAKQEITEWEGEIILISDIDGVLTITPFKKIAKKIFQHLDTHENPASRLTEIIGEKATKIKNILILSSRKKVADLDYNPLKLLPLTTTERKNQELLNSVKEKTGIKEVDIITTLTKVFPISTENRERIKQNFFNYFDQVLKQNTKKEAKPVKIIFIGSSFVEKGLLLKMLDLYMRQQFSRKITIERNGNYYDRFETRKILESHTSLYDTGKFLT